MTIRVITPTDLDLSLVRNATTVLDLVLTDETGVAVNITSDTIQFNVFDAGGAIVIQKTSTPGGHEDPTNGVARVTLTSTDWDSLTGSGRQTRKYEVRRVDSLTREFVHVAGDVTVSPTNV